MYSKTEYQKGLSLSEKFLNLYGVNPVLTTERGGET